MMVVAKRTHVIGNAGQIAVSAEAQAQLGLAVGAHLTELVVDGLLVYVPTEIALERALDLDFERALEALQRHLAERGITADDLIADIDQHKDETFQTFYADVE